MSVYMVFPYMDHDLAGLLENERVKLTPSQIKLYMKQLLEGTEYMHYVRLACFPWTSGELNQYPEQYRPPRHEGSEPPDFERWVSQDCRHRSRSVV